MDFTQQSDKVYSKHAYFGTEAVSLSREDTYDSDDMVDFLISVLDFFFTGTIELNNKRYFLEIQRQGRLQSSFKVTVSNPKRSEKVE